MNTRSARVSAMILWCQNAQGLSMIGKYAVAASPDNNKLSFAAHLANWKCQFYKSLHRTFCLIANLILFSLGE